MPPRGESKPMTKAELLREVASKANITQSDVEKVLNALEELTKQELKSTGEFSPLPGLLKVKKKRKPAAPARDGRNPSTGAAMRIPAKPAHDVVKVTVLTKLKDMV